MNLRTPITALGIAALLGGAAYAQSGTTVPQPILTTTTTTTGAGTQIIGPNPTRRTIRICNLHATSAAWIWPTASTSSTPCSTLVSAYVLAPVTSNAASCYTPPTGGALPSNAGARWCVSTTLGTMAVEEWQ